LQYARTEKDVPDPQDPYAVSKCEAERVVGSFCVDSRKIRTMLGWKPLFTVEEGMKRSF
jgi:nucleoside-diphosphate-sugar epimerase